MVPPGMCAVQGGAKVPLPLPRISPKVFEKKKIGPDFYFGPMISDLWFVKKPGEGRDLPAISV